MDIAAAIARWLVGLFYAYIGGDWLLHQILEEPWITPEKTESAKALLAALTASGIVDPLIATTSLIGGLMLLVRRTAPLGIAILAPLVVGIFLFHLLLTDSWLWGTAHLVLLLMLAWLHRSAFRPLWSYGVGHAE